MLNDVLVAAKEQKRASVGWVVFCSSVTALGLTIVEHLQLVAELDHSRVLAIWGRGQKVELARDRLESSRKLGRGPTSAHESIVSSRLFCVHGLAVVGPDHSGGWTSGRRWPRRGRSRGGRRRRVGGRLLGRRWFRGGRWLCGRRRLSGRR